MKFWKILCNLIESTLPEWRDEYISYKELKKQLKKMYPKENDGTNPNKRLKLDGEAEANSMEIFLNLLQEELDKFNQFFEAKEEFYVIKWRLLQDKVANVGDSNEMLMKVGRDIVDFHGEMVLLENYSALNYTGLVKILKKYDKWSGELIRVPFIKKVLRQPFYSTEVLDKLLKECEVMLDLLFFKKDMSTATAATAINEEERGCSEAKTSATTKAKEKVLNIPEDLAEIENMESMYMKLTLSALNVLNEIRGGSSTI